MYFLSRCFTLCSVEVDADAAAAAVEKLLPSGFAEHYCSAAVAAVGVDSVDDALDWLCAHVPEADLPP